MLEINIENREKHKIEFIFNEEYLWWQFFQFILNHID